MEAPYSDMLDFDIMGFRDHRASIGYRRPNQTGNF